MDLTWRQQTEPLPTLPRRSRVPRKALARQLHRIEADQRQLKRRVGTIYAISGLVLVIVASAVLSMSAAGMTPISGTSSQPPAHQFNASAIVSPSTPTFATTRTPTPSNSPVTPDATVAVDETVPSQASFVTGVKIQPTQAEAETTSPTPTTSSTPVGDVSEILTLSIPAIGLIAPTETRTIDASGAMETAGPFEVAWYGFTSHPQRGGNAVFSGHVDYVGVGPAVFWELGTVREGDEIQLILAAGTALRYQVTAMTVGSAGSDASTLNEIIGPTAVPSITLFTCAGQFDTATGQYDDRLIARAERMLG